MHIMPPIPRISRECFELKFASFAVCFNCSIKKRGRKINKSTYTINVKVLMGFRVTWKEIYNNNLVSV